VRVITQGVKYEASIPGFEGHPIIRTTDKTKLANGAYHFHLRYLKTSPYQNNSLYSLPAMLSGRSVYPFLKKLPFKLTPEIEGATLELLQGKPGLISTTSSCRSRRELLPYINYDCVQFRGDGPCKPHAESGQTCPTCPQYVQDVRERLLIVNTDTPDQIADSCFVIRELKLLYPSCFIWYVCRAENREIVQAKAQPDAVVSDTLEVVALLGSVKFDIAMNFGRDVLGEQLLSVTAATVKKGGIARPDGKVQPATIGGYHRFQALNFPGVAAGTLGPQSLLAETFDVNDPTSGSTGPRARR
jgi:hypothetical protein